MNFAQIRYTSSLQRGDQPPPRGADARRAVGRVHPHRRRYMGLPEEFDYNTTTSTAPASTNNFRINTDNQMYGAQVGGMLEFYVDNRWWFNFEVKGAVMNDRTTLTTFYQNIPATGTAPPPTPLPRNKTTRPSPRTSA